jgi:hypothetical protein
MSGEPENLVLELLRGLRADVARLETNMATKSELAELRTELKADLRSLRADVASDLATMRAENDAEHKATRKQLGDQIIGLRRAVVEYHSVVIGHGVLISELEARVRRVEQHLGLPPALDAH